MVDQQKTRPARMGFLGDDRGVIAAVYGLVMIIACGCLTVLAFTLGHRISPAMYSAAEAIKAESAVVAR